MILCINDNYISRFFIFINDKYLFLYFLYTSDTHKSKNNRVKMSEKLRRKRMLFVATSQGNSNMDKVFACIVN